MCIRDSLKALQLLDQKNKQDLITVYNSNDKEKISKTLDLYNKCNIENEVAAEIKKYTDNALGILESLKIAKEKKEFLHNFGNSLMQRKI